MVEKRKISLYSVTSCFQALSLYNPAISPGQSRVKAYTFPIASCRLIQGLKALLRAIHKVIVESVEFSYLTTGP
jgi:hypothetical protein